MLITSSKLFNKAHTNLSMLPFHYRLNKKVNNERLYENKHNKIIISNYFIEKNVDLPEYFVHDIAHAINFFRSGRTNRLLEINFGYNWKNVVSKYGMLIYRNYCDYLDEIDTSVVQSILIDTIRGENIEDKFPLAFSSLRDVWPNLDSDSIKHKCDLIHQPIEYWNKNCVLQTVEEMTKYLNKLEYY